MHLYSIFGSSICSVNMILRLFFKNFKHKNCSNINFNIFFNFAKKMINKQKQRESESKRERGGLREWIFHEVGGMRTFFN